MLIYCLAFIILWSSPGSTKRPSTSKTNSINDSRVVINEIINLHLSKRFFDVVLKVGEEEFHAHRILLALRSSYFRKLFYGDEKTDEVAVTISAEPVVLFKKLFKYIYTAQIALSALEGEDIFKLFDMANFLGIQYLQSERPMSNIRCNKPIDHIDFLISDISSLCQNKMFSDVVFVLGRERLHAHRFLLASHSRVFRAMFYGGLKEKYKKVVELSNVSYPSFQLLLGYIYTGQLNLKDLEDDDIFELIKISDFYDILNLKHKLQEYLKKSINPENVCSFYVTTRLRQLKELEFHSLIFIDMNAPAVLDEVDFRNLSTEALREILNRDTFFAEELEIFNAVCQWINANKNHLDRDTKINILSDVRYPLMNDEELSKARESPLVSSDIISDAIELRYSLTTDKPQLRGQLIPDQYLRHQNVPATARGVNMIKLHNLSLVNFIEITLWYGTSETVDHRSYSYYVEVSRNGHDWDLVIDHSNYNCQSHQFLWIHPQLVRYIRFVGANITPKASFIIWRLEYNTKDMRNVEINNGLVVPKGEYNVASAAMNAIVIQGENNFDGKTLLARYEESDFRYERYTYHPVGSGSIVVHLTQPYILSSMRMLLWGGDNYTYKYTIAVSVDGQHWKTVVYKSDENTRSWQLLKFEPTPTLYIRITGVFSSANNVFRCIYMQAPAHVPVDSNADQH